MPFIQYVHVELWTLQERTTQDYNLFAGWCRLNMYRTFSLFNSCFQNCYNSNQYDGICQLTKFSNKLEVALHQSLPNFFKS